MQDILSTIAKPGVHQLLLQLVDSSETASRRDQLESHLSELGSNDPSRALDDIVSANLVQRVGERFSISRFGQKAALLLSALRGGDAEDVLRRIRRLEGTSEPYELVRQGMTTRFFRSLIDRPGFGRLFICSPWVNPTARDVDTLKYAMLKLAERGHPAPEILIITRPMDKQYDKTGESLDPFRELGATIHVHSRLHSKLYIREPGSSGGVLMAMVGSENLTRGNNLELGIQISGDDRLVNQLVAYFWELTSYK